MDRHQPIGWVCGWLLRASFSQYKLSCSICSYIQRPDLLDLSGEQMVIIDHQSHIIQRQPSDILAYQVCILDFHSEIEFEMPGSNLFAYRHARLKFLDHGTGCPQRFDHRRRTLS